MMTLLRLVGNVWALPGALIGLVFALLSFPSRWWFLQGALVVGVRRILVPPWACGITFGFVVLVEAGSIDGDNERLVKHELVHVAQWRVLGVLFLLAYPLASAVAALSGKHYYRDNWFEKQAVRLSAGPVG